MLISEIAEQKNWLKTFNKKFANFCKNAPIVLAFDSSFGREIKVTGYVPEKREASFPYNFDEDVSDYIAMIREWMLPRWYPTVIRVEKETRKLDSSEIAQIMMHENITFEEALEREVVDEWRSLYRIEKVFNDQNAVVLRNMETGETETYLLTVPVTSLVERIVSGDEKADQSFFQFAKLSKKEQEHSA